MDAFKYSIPVVYMFNIPVFIKLSHKASLDSNFNSMYISSVDLV